MEKNPTDLAYQILREVVFAGEDKKSSAAISKLLELGKIRETVAESAYRRADGVSGV